MYLNLLNSNFWSAVAGALLGGLIALVAQGLERRAAVRDRAGEKHSGQKALVAHLLAKLTRMHRQLAGLVQHFNNCERDAPPGLEAWTWARPLAALPHPSAFTADELANVFVLDTALFNDIGLFEDRYQVAIGTYVLYAEHRAALLAQLIPNQMDGIIGHLDVDEATHRRTAPARAELNEMLPVMRQHNQADYESARDLIVRVIALLNRQFGGTLTANFEEPGAAAIRE